MDIQKAIRERRSVGKFKDIEIDSVQIIQLLEDAVYAPNHKMREPWRFILVSQNRAMDLKETIRSWMDSDTEKKFDKIFAAPMVLACVNQLNQNYVDEIEDLQATAAVIQNFMLLSYEKGIGTFWKTPDFIESDLFKEALGLKTDEIIVALIMVGYPLNEDTKRGMRVSAAKKTTIY